MDVQGGHFKLFGLEGAEEFSLHHLALCCLGRLAARKVPTPLERGSRRPVTTLERRNDRAHETVVMTVVVLVAFFWLTCCFYNAHTLAHFPDWHLPRRPVRGAVEVEDSCQVIPPEDQGRRRRLDIGGRVVHE